jgi:hypothetical protein
MNHLSRRLLASCAAVVAAITVLVAPGGRPAHAEPCQRTVVINPQVSVGEGAGRLVLAVYSAGCAAAGQVDYAVTPGSAAPGADFELTGGRLTWSPGDTSPRPIVATILGDHATEAVLENFTVTLVNPSGNVVVLNATAQGRILDDDRPDVSWVVDDQLCVPRLGFTSEALGPDGGLPWFGLRPMCGAGHGVIHNVPSIVDPAPRMLTWGTSDGTAVAGVDYVGVPAQTVAVPAGAAAVEVNFELLPRPEGTGDRWFLARLAAVSSGTIVDPTAVVTIVGS